MKLLTNDTGRALFPLTGVPYSIILAVLASGLVWVKGRWTRH
ncbi:MAG: hypothetical protein AB7O49_12805 [Sphingomonadales bacterium]